MCMKCMLGQFYIRVDLVGACGPVSCAIGGNIHLAIQCQMLGGNFELWEYVVEMNRQYTLCGLE